LIHLFDWKLSITILADPLTKNKR